MGNLNAVKNMERNVRGMQTDYSEISLFTHTLAKMKTSDNINCQDDVNQQEHFNSADEHVMCYNFGKQFGTIL